MLRFLRKKWVNIVFGILPALILISVFGPIGWMFDVGYLLEIFHKLSDGHLQQTNLTGLYLVPLAPIGTIGVVIFIYVILGDDNKIQSLTRSTRLGLGSCLLLAMLASFFGCLALFEFKANRKNPGVWILFFVNLLQSIITINQIYRLLGTKARDSQITSQNRDPVHRPES